MGGSHQEDSGWDLEFSEVDLESLVLLKMIVEVFDVLQKCYSAERPHSQKMSPRWQGWSPPH